MSEDDKKVLDFGAGIGEFSNRFDHQERIYVVEQDQVQLEMSKTENRFRSVDDLKDEMFDLIYSLNVLEHIEEDKKLVKTLLKHLNAGGEFRIFVPAKMVLYSSMDKAVGHFRRYEKDELCSLFELDGLIIENCSYFDFLGYFAALVYKIVGSKEGDLSKKSILFYDRVIFPLSALIDKITFGRVVGKNLMLIARKTT